MSYTATISGQHLRLDFGTEQFYYPADQIELQPHYNPNFYFLNNVVYDWTDCTSFGVLANRDSFFAQLNAILPTSGGGNLSSDVTATLTVTSDLIAQTADITNLTVGVGNATTFDAETLTAHTFTVSDFTTNTFDVGTKINFPNATAAFADCCISAINQSFGSDTMVSLNDCEGSWVSKGSKVAANSIALAVGSNRNNNDAASYLPLASTAIAIGNLHNRFITGGVAGVDTRADGVAGFSGGVGLFAKVSGAGDAGLFGDGADIELDNCKTFIFCDGLNSTIENFYPTTFSTDVTVNGSLSGQSADFAGTVQSVSYIADDVDAVATTTPYSIVEDSFGNGMSGFKGADNNNQDILFFNRQNSATTSEILRLASTGVSEFTGEVTVSSDCQVNRMKINAEQLDFAVESTPFTYIVDTLPGAVRCVNIPVGGAEVFIPTNQPIGTMFFVKVGAGGGSVDIKTNDGGTVTTVASIAAGGGQGFVRFSTGGTGWGNV